MITQIESGQSQQRLNPWTASRPAARRSDLRNILFVLVAAALTFVLASYVAYRRFSPARLTFASSATLHEDLADSDLTERFGLRP